MWNNIIKYVEEITSNGDFKYDNEDIFYVFIQKKDENSNDIVNIDSKLSGNRQYVSVPYVANLWNPILVKELNIENQLFDSYRLFVGKDY